MFDPKMIAELARSLPPREADNGYPTLKLRLELAGHDPDDPDTLMAAIAALRAEINELRTGKSLIAALTENRLTDAIVGAAIGKPRSTVQAMASGRKAERLTRAERQALCDFITEHLAAVGKVLAQVEATL